MSNPYYGQPNPQYFPPIHRGSVNYPNHGRVQSFSNLNSSPSPERISVRRHDSPIKSVVPSYPQNGSHTQSSPNLDRGVGLRRAPSYDWQQYQTLQNSHPHFNYGAHPSKQNVPIKPMYPEQLSRGELALQNRMEKQKDVLDRIGKDWGEHRASLDHDMMLKAHYDRRMKEREHNNELKLQIMKQQFAVENLLKNMQGPTNVAPPFFHNHNINPVNPYYYHQPEQHSPQRRNDSDRKRDPEKEERRRRREKQRLREQERVNAQIMQNMQNLANAQRLSQQLNNSPLIPYRKVPSTVVLKPREESTDSDDSDERVDRFPLYQAYVALRHKTLGLRKLPRRLVPKTPESSEEEGGPSFDEDDEEESEEEPPRRKRTSPKKPILKNPPKEKSQPQPQPKPPVSNQRADPTPKPLPTPVPKQTPQQSEPMPVPDSREKQERKKLAKSKLRSIMWTIAYPIFLNVDVYEKVHFRKKVENEAISRKDEDLGSDLLVWVHDLTEKGFDALFADGTKSYDFISQPNHNDNKNKASSVRNIVRGLLESLMKNDDTQPLDDKGLDYLASLTLGELYALDGKLSNFEIMRIPFNTYGRFKDITQEQCELIVACTLMVRVLVFNLILMAKVWYENVDWTENLPLNLKIVGSVIYRLTISVFEDTLIINPNPSELPIIPMKPLNSSSIYPLYSSNFFKDGKKYQASMPKETEIILGLYTNQELELVFQDRVWTDSMRNHIKQWAAEIHQKVREYRRLNPKMKPPSVA